MGRLYSISMPARSRPGFPDAGAWEKTQFPSFLPFLRSHWLTAKLDFTKALLAVRLCSSLRTKTVRFLTRCYNPRLVTSKSENRLLFTLTRLGHFQSRAFLGLARETFLAARRMSKYR